MNPLLCFGPVLYFIGILILLSGCVYQPIQVDVFIPTTVQAGQDIVLDTVGNKLREVSK